MNINLMLFTERDVIATGRTSTLRWNGATVWLHRDDSPLRRKKVNTLWFSVKINKLVSTLNETGFRLDLLLWSTGDNTEVVILCLNGQEVIKTQIWAELMFHFCSRCEGWCERHNRRHGWSSTRTARIWSTFHVTFWTEKHRSHKSRQKIV